MATRPGEDLAATLFADVHYFYGPPTTKPPHHRFDKGSYVYLFENPSQRRARIEVANNAGTPEQDAFNGYLDAAHVHYSYKHSTLVTVTVDGSGQPTAVQSTQEWHLPTFDPRNENKYMYRLHTVDLYFWAKEDAVVFVNGLRRVLPSQQITVQDEPLPPPPHQEEMSPVVQQLENIAISDPSYQQGRTRDSRTTNSSISGPSMTGPPISATPQSQEASNFAPMAYNPAAPAAPEAIRHREKTPPPEDAAGNPLMAAASTDQGQPFAAPPYGQQGFSGPPGQSQSGYPPSALFNSTPTPASQFQPQPQSQPGPTSPFAQHFQNTFAPPPTAETSRSPYAQPPPAPPAYQAQQNQAQNQNPAHIPVTQQFAQYPGSPLSSPGIYSPGLTSPGLHQPNAQFMPQPQSPDPTPGISHAVTAPPGGFSQYNYQKTSNTQPLMGDYSIHQQVYRPTEGEVNKHKVPKPNKGKLEAGAGSLERSVTGLLKKLEKKIG